VLPGTVQGDKKVPTTLHDCVENLKVVFLGVSHQASERGLDQVSDGLKTERVVQLLTGAHFVEDFAKGVSEIGSIIVTLKLIHNDLLGVRINALLTTEKHVELISHYDLLYLKLLFDSQLSLSFSVLILIIGSYTTAPCCHQCPLHTSLSLLGETTLILITYGSQELPLC
jgi:hypothetical protein